MISTSGRVLGSTYGDLKNTKFTGMIISDCHNIVYTRFTRFNNMETFYLTVNFRNTFGSGIGLPSRWESDGKFPVIFIHFDLMSKGKIIIK